MSSSKEVEKLLPMPECIDAMETMFRSIGYGETKTIERTITALRGGKLVIMPASQGAVISAKVMTIFDGNSHTPFETIQGAVLIFETDNGRLLGILDSTRLTAIRTAAVSSLATRLLARSDASSLAILGSGTQAAAHLKAMSFARNISKARVWSRNRTSAERLAGRAGNLDVTAVSSVQEAVKNADIICTTTSSPLPILNGDWLSEGCHINAIGAYSKTTRELDTRTVKQSRLFVDSREAAMKEAGDFLIPLNEGEITHGHILGDLSDLVTGEVKGRTNDTDMTLFKSVGLAIEDTVASFVLYQKASRESTGTWIEFGSEREA